MNTCFYNELKNDGYLKIKKWGGDFLQYPKNFKNMTIYVPIHHPNHWALVQIKLSENNRTISYFDSLGGSDKVDEVFSHLLKYIYLKENEKDFIDDKKHFKEYCKKWDTEFCKSPQQTNGIDCGFFLLANSLFLSHDKQLTYSQDDIPFFRLLFAMHLRRGYI
jgi:sentrin-specific protease 1